MNNNNAYSENKKSKNNKINQTNKNDKKRAIMIIIRIATARIIVIIMYK